MESPDEVIRRRTATAVPATGRDGWLAVLAAATLWGTTGVVFHILGASAGADAVSISFLRLALSVPFFLAMARFRTGTWLPSLSSRGLLVLAGLGLSMAAYQLTYVLAIERVGVAISVLISICGAPVIVALISVFWFREPFNVRTLCAMVFAIIGTILLVGLPSKMHHEAVAFWIGIGWSVTCAVCYALYILVARAAGSACGPMHADGIGFAIGALALLPFSAGSGVQLTYTLGGWALLIYVAAVPTAIAQSLFLDGIKQTGAVGGSIATLLEPLVSTVLALIVLGERMTWYGALGAVILLSGIVIMQGRPPSDVR